MDPILIPIVALLIPIVIVPTALGFRHARFLREVEHAERMRAMELGRTLAEDEAWSPARLAVAIGVGVPIGSLLIAWLAAMTTGSTSAEADLDGAGVVGLGGVICGTVLAARHFAGPPAGRRDPPGVEKPEYDPDAYDVVGRRG